MEGYILAVYPFVKGADGFTQRLTHKQWISLGKTLRQLHDLHVPWALLPQVRTERFSPEHRDAVRQLQQQLDSIQAPDQVAERLLESLQTHQTTIQRLVDRAEQLAQQAKVRSHSFVLCHADIHGGNVLLDHEERLYIVDWEDPVLAPRERDLMFIGGGIANVWNDPAEEQAFYQGYGDIAIDRSLLAYYRHERIVGDIAECSRDLLKESVSLKDRDTMYQHFLDMFTPGGVIDIAFMTDLTSRSEHP